MKKLSAALVLAVLSLVSLPLRAEENCTFKKGEARWSIKTSVAPGALDNTPKPIDLHALIGLSNPSLTKGQKDALQNKRWPTAVRIQRVTGSLHEGDIVSVTGFLYRVRCQPDADFHLEIGTAEDRDDAECLIVEIPDPDEISDAALKARIEAVRQSLQQVPDGIFGPHPTDAPPHVQLAGQLFLDATHIGHGAPGGGRGTNGCATNVWEIHPVTDLTVQ